MYGIALFSMLITFNSSKYQLLRICMPPAQMAERLGTMFRLAMWLLLLPTLAVQYFMLPLLDEPFAEAGQRQWRISAALVIGYQLLPTRLPFCCADSDNRRGAHSCECGGIRFSALAQLPR